MRKRLWLLVVLVAAGAVGAASAGVLRPRVARPAEPVTLAPRGMAITLWVEGGGVPDGMTPGQPVRVMRVRHEVRIPQESGAGPATGQRHHEEVIVSMPMGSLSPGWHKAMRQNTLLGKAILQWQRNGVPFYTVTLTHARVGSMATRPDEAAGQVDEIGLVYERIEWTSLPDGRTDVDDWH